MGPHAFRKHAAGKRTPQGQLESKKHEKKPVHFLSAKPHRRHEKETQYVVVRRPNPNKG